MGVTVYGSSDDIVEVEGDVEEEFTLIDKTGYLALSDGSVFSIEYTREGIWRIHSVANPSVHTIESAVTGGEDGYSDRLVIDRVIDWVVFGTEFVRA